MRRARFGPGITAIGTLGALLWTGAGSVTRADTGSASEPDPIRVGVVVVDAINIDLTGAIEIGDQLTSVLTEVLVIEAVNSSEAVARLEPAASDDCVIKRRCIRRVGQQLGVDEILFLTIVRVGDQAKVNITWADASSAEALPRGALTMDLSADMALMFTYAAYALLPGAASRPEPAEPVDGPDSGGMTGRGTSTLEVSSSTDTTARGGRRMTTASWIVGGSGVVALIVGGGFGAAAWRLDGKLSDRCPETQCDSRRSRDIDLRKRHINTADILYGVAAVAGTTALILYLLSGDDGESSRVGVTATPDMVGVSVGARF